MDAFGEGGTPGQMRGMIGAVAVMHLEANDLPAVEIEDQVQIEPPPLHDRRQERHIPAPDSPRSGGDVRGWRTRPARWLGAAAAMHLPVCAQHPMEAGFAGDIDAFIGQHRYDPCGRRLGEARLVRDFDDARPFFFCQSVRWRWPDRVRPPIAACQTIVLSPALESAWIDPRQSAGGSLPRAAGAGLSNLVNQDLAIFQAGHASSPSWKIAWSFFDSTSKAAVSASALSLRCSSRSSSLFRRRSCFRARLSVSRGSPRPPIASCFQVSKSVG